MLKLRKRALVVLVGVAFAGCIIGCSPQLSSTSGERASQDAGDAEPAATQVEFSEEADCAVCHTVEIESMSDSSCLAGLGSHASMDCLTCHEYNSDLEKAHEKVSVGDTPRKNLKRTEVDESACVTCHDETGLVEKTASATVLTDSKGTTVNPHALPENDGHAEIACADCHKMHAGGADAAQDATNKCLSCHHDGVFECGTCHSA